ncbi:MAG: hypothetical protein QOH89_2331 [Pseudonocardiales bacterium]|nr:hypothetical protein [Pseudonocardiales bacterium]
MALARKTRAHQCATLAGCSASALGNARPAGPSRLSDTPISVIVLDGADLSGAWRWCASAVAGLTWPVIGCLVAVSIVHYVAAAAASRAAAGVRLPVAELIAMQFTASAANRLTPAGIGGAGVIARYLTRRGQLAPAEAAAAVSSLALLGGLADVAAFAVVVGAGTVFGLAGAATEVPMLLSRLIGLVPVPVSWWRYAVLGIGVGVALTVAIPPIRHSTAVRRGRFAAGQFIHAVATLIRRPRRLATLMGASAATTLVLAAGFAAAAVVGPTALSPAGFAALMIGYMVASAAGNAVPTPGGIGTADAALAGVLLAAHATAAAALATVLAFRIVTFWVPALAGVALARPLRRRGAL